MAANKNFNIGIVFCLFVLFTSVNLFAEVLSPIIQDNAELLSDEEEAQLYKVMEPIVEYGGVAFITNKESHSNLSADLAKSYCEKLFKGESGIVFLLDMHNRRIEFYSTGKIYEVMGVAWSDIVADNVYEYATNRKYFICAQKAFTQIHTILEGGTVAAPMREVSFTLLGTALSFMFLFLMLCILRERKIFGEKVPLLKGDDDVPSKNLKVVVREKKLLVDRNYKGGGSSRSSFSSSSRSSSYSGGSSSRSSGGGGGHGF